MQTVALVIIFWSAIAVAVSAAFSIYKQHDRVFVWKDEIADELVEHFNVDYREAFRIVDSAFSFRTVMYKTHLMERPNAIALRLFWHRADRAEWMPHHFISRQLPEALYTHPSWGGIVVDA